MKTIDIPGKVVGGCGKFREEIHLPNDLLIDHGSWMPSFVQGTLNVQFSISCLPDSLQIDGLRALDLNDAFQPAIYRIGSDVSGNTLRPSDHNPSRGDLQLWRAILRNLQTKTVHNCFLIRRVDSGYKDIAEILGQHNFRSNFRFDDGHQVVIQVLSGTGET